MPVKGNPRPPLATSTLAGPARDESTDRMALLDCRGRSPASLYEEIHALARVQPSDQGVFFLVPLHLEHIEGSLTGAVLGLESILQTFPAPVVLGDPSGYATLVLTTLQREADVRIYRPAGPSARPRRVLIVDGSGPSAESVCAALEAFGHTLTLARTGVEARRAVKALDFDFVLLDLDLPRMQSFGIAQSVKERMGIAMVGVTTTDDPWARENLARFGFRKVLQKRPSALEMLDELAGLG